MGVLSDRIVEKLISLSTSEKEIVGRRIVESLGGDSSKVASKLPPRRGNADGGIDGRIPIIRKVSKTKTRPNGTQLYKEDVKEEEAIAAFCIKIENSGFDREQLGAFKNDMERERIFEGIIVSAKELTPDAKCDLKRINNDGRFKISHIVISDFLSGEFDVDFEFETNPKSALRMSLGDFIRK